MEIIGVIVAGIIIGLLGKFVAPGSRDNTPIWLTILCGIGGVLIGWFIYTALGGNGSPGIDWVRWLIAIAVAAVLVVLASTVTGRKMNTNGWDFWQFVDGNGRKLTLFDARQAFLVQQNRP